MILVIRNRILFCFSDVRIGIGKDWTMMIDIVIPAQCRSVCRQQHTYKWNHQISLEVKLFIKVRSFIAHCELRTGFYFSCFEVTSVRHERLSPPGIGLTTSINGEDGPGIIVVRIVVVIGNTLASFW